MSESLYMVDIHATQPPVPAGLSQGRQCIRAVHLLILLVSMALCGMAIQACFIYHLHKHESATPALSLEVTAGQDPTKRPSLVHSPSKPVAHLTDGQDVIHGNQIMAWSMTAEPLLFGMDYKNGGLVIQQEGYYFVYSKVFFVDNGAFQHSINRKTDLIMIPLLMSRTYSERSRQMRSNGYLGGVFHLTKDDALCVQVSNTSKLVRHKSFDNIFGAYMI